MQTTRIDDDRLEPSSVTSEGYRTTPNHDNSGWPPGVPYIVGNEACERFSYYGMRVVLMAHLTALFVLTYTVLDQAQASKLALGVAAAVVHLFFAGVYALPMIGALIADRLLGKYRTILYLSLVYCAGHGVLALWDQSLMGMYVGLALIAIGSGGIKSCVSANVGDQFGNANWHRLRTVYQIFYFSINFGSFFATILIPIIREELGSSVAFGIPGVLMFIATVLFWMGRRKFVHVPPSPSGKVGLLDMLSSVCLFLSFGHLFFTWGTVNNLEPMAKLAILLPVSLGFLAVGLFLFARRHRLPPDDGFLAITLYALVAWFRSARRAPPPAEGSSNDNGPGMPDVDPVAQKLSRSYFWAPAVEKFGAKATEGPVAVFKIISVFFLISIFWALFDQKVTTWVAQAELMNRTIHLPWGKIWEIKASQTIAANPFLVMVLIPLVNIFYRWCDDRGINFSPLKRISIGMLITSLSFFSVAAIQAAIEREEPGQVSI